MNFFKSVFADDPDETKQDSDLESLTNLPQKQIHEEEPQPNSSSDQQPHLGPNNNSSGADGIGWSFGGLLKTLSTRSELVLETYCRDLKEFGSGLKKETTAFKEVASRAVKDLPASIEVAQGSLETVGHAIDEFGNSVLKSTVEIVSHGKDSLLEDTSVNFDNQSVDSKQNVSRFSARVHTIQSDSRTYCEEPEDLDDFCKWKLGFVLKEKGEEVEKLIAENVAVGSVYRRVVPNEVDHETFWYRYFYKIHRLKQAEGVRANLVKKAMLEEDGEDLKWDDVDDVDDDDDEEVGTYVSSKGDSSEVRDVGSLDAMPIVQEKEDLIEKKPLENKEPLEVVEGKGDSLEKEEVGNENSRLIAEECSGGKLRGGSTGVVDKNGKNGPIETNRVGIVTEPRSDSGSEEKIISERTVGMNADESVSKPTEERGLEGRLQPGESSKDGDVLVVSILPSLPDEDDLEWDEIEDIASNIEETATHQGGNRDRTNLRKRLSVAEEEEELSWDIEDADEPVKA